MIPFPLFLALKYLRPKRTFVSLVTVISVLGVILGVAILVIVMAVMTGFDDMWRVKILSFKPHLIVRSAYGRVIDDEYQLSDKIEKIPGVIGVTPSIQAQALIRFGARTSAPIVVGVDPSRAADVSQVPANIIEGRFDLEGNSVVLGVGEARKMGLNVGDKILVYSEANMAAMTQNEICLPEELVLTGIFNMGMQKFDSGIMLTSVDVARDLVGLRSGAYSIFIMTDDPFKFFEYSNEVEHTLGPGYYVSSWKDEDRVLFEALSHEKGLMSALLAVITIVAIFCVTNTLIVITYQKTNEIGLLKALGFSPWKIMMVFVIHGWIQCAIGTAAGIGTGLLVLHNLKNIVVCLSKINVNAFPPEIYGLSEIPWVVSWGDLRFIAIFVMVSCTVISLVPAYRAMRLNPVEALRHE